jgi:hypothetical protein
MNDTFGSSRRHFLKIGATGAAAAIVSDGTVLKVSRTFRAQVVDAVVRRRATERP